MIFRRHEGPGTPVHGRPYDEDADTPAPEQGEAVSADLRSPAADPAHDARTDPGPDAPDWSGARHESTTGAAPGTAPERDALPDEPALDRGTQPDPVGGSRPEHADRLVAGRGEQDDVPPAAPSATSAVTGTTGTTETTDGTADGTLDGTTDVPGRPGRVDGTTGTTTETTDGTADRALDDTTDVPGRPGRVDGTTGRDDALADADDVSRQDAPVPSPAVTGAPETEEASSPTGRHVAGDPADTGLLGWDADEVRRRWQEVQVAFVDDPRESVERADTMVDEAVSALSARRRELMDDWKNTGQGDTERLRLALRDYRSLLERLTGPFHGADRGVR